MGSSRRFVLDKANIGACIIVLLLATGIASAGGALTQWLIQSFWLGFITVVVLLITGAVMLYRSRHPAQIVASAPSTVGIIVRPNAPTPPEQHQEPHKALLDDTAEFPPVIMNTEAPAQRVPPRKNTSSYTVTTDENGVQHLIVEHWRKSGRRKNLSWTSQQLKLRLNDMSLIDTRILMRGVFEPNSDEKVIEVAKRRHWWSHTPQQVGVFLAWLAGIIAVGIGLDRLAGTTWLWVLGLIWTIVWAVTGFLVWMKWAFTYFIVTDRRILLIYRPPAPFPADSNQSPMSRLQGLRSYESAIGRLLKFGTIYSETAASETDEWIKEGVDHLKDSSRIEAKISGYTK